MVNSSSRRNTSNVEVPNGTTAGMGVGADGQGADALAGSVAGGTTRASPAVLGGDRTGPLERGRRSVGGCVAGSRKPVVPRGWRHATDPSHPTFGTLPVVCRAGGDRDHERRRLRGVRDRPLAGSLALEDLSRELRRNAATRSRRLEYRTPIAQWKA